MAAEDSGEGDVDVGAKQTLLAREAADALFGWLTGSCC